MLTPAQRTRLRLLRSRGIWFSVEVRQGLSCKYNEFGALREFTCTSCGNSWDEHVAWGGEGNGYRCPCCFGDVREGVHTPFRARRRSIVALRRAA